MCVGPTVVLNEEPSCGAGLLSFTVTGSAGNITVSSYTGGQIFSGPGTYVIGSTELTGNGVITVNGINNCPNALVNYSSTCQIPNAVTSATIANTVCNGPSVSAEVTLSGTAACNTFGGAVVSINSLTIGAVTYNIQLGSVDGDDMNPCSNWSLTDTSVVIQDLAAIGQGTYNGILNTDGGNVAVTITVPC